METAMPNLNHLNHLLPGEIGHLGGAPEDAYDVDEFASRHRISRATVYNLWKRGLGPKYMQVGSRRLISREAAAEWRRQMERQPEAAA
jgi:Helix-turn-helix domain